MKTALHFDRPDRVTCKQLQCFEIGRFGPALTENLGKVEQVNVVLQDEIGEPIHRQRAGMQLAEKLVTFDRPPNALAATPQLRAEFFSHRLALTKISAQKKSGQWIMGYRRHPFRRKTPLRSSVLDHQSIQNRYSV